MPVKTSSLRLPPKLHDDVTLAAQAAKLSRNSFIERALRIVVYNEQVRGIDAPSRDLQEQIDELRARLERMERLAEGVT